jgi:hypothetical protein
VNAPEEWRPIAGFPDYLVSDLGRVVSRRPHARARVKDCPPRELAGGQNGQGYRYVKVSRDGEFSVKRYVHHLVAEAFHGPRPEGLHVRHIDGDSLNNAADNLRYGTASENERDKIRHGANPHSRKTHCLRSHPYDEANTLYRPTSRGTFKRHCRACARERYRARGPKLTTSTEAAA